MEDRIMAFWLGISLFTLLLSFCLLYATRNEKEEIRDDQTKRFDEHPDL